MINFINKNKLLATTAICAISICANTVKAEEISISDILNNSTTKSPNITWEQVTSAGENTIQIGDKYYKYTYTTPTDYTEVKDKTENISLINPTEQSTYKYIGLGVNNSEGTDYGDIENVVFSNNKVTATFENNGSYRYLYVYGGAISNQGTVGDITADFIDNSIDVLATNLSNNYDIYNHIHTDVYGGAIYNQGTIGDITADFVNNSICINQGANNKSTSYKDAIGGAIYNRGTIGDITGNFVGNSAKTSQNDGYGGAIYNDNYYSNGTYIRGIIGDITGDFIGNSANDYGAIYNGGTIGNITGNFIGNSATGGEADAGAIGNRGTIDSIIGTFIGNGTNQADGSAYTHVSTIYNSGTIGVLSGDFINNYINSADYSSYRRVAVYNGWDSQMTLLADGSTDASNPYHQEVLFKGNYAIDEYGNKSYEALYSEGEINFESRNGGSFTFYDIIHIQDIMNLTGDGNVGVFNMYNDIYTVNFPTLNIQNPYIFNMINQKANTISWQGNINIEEETTLNLDVFLSTGTSDIFYFPLTGVRGSDVITGRDKFKIGQVNVVEDIADNTEYVKVAYSNVNLTQAFTYTQSTSGGVYSIFNDGQNLMVEKTDGKGGFAAFLANENSLQSEREYSFTKDEDMRLAIVNNLDKTATVENEDAKLTIFGNNHTLSYLTGKNSKAMNLLEDQTAQINNLTIKGFATGLSNRGTMTLNNVTLKDNGTALQNNGDIYFEGENTISGSGYAMYFQEKFKYPVLSAIIDGFYVAEIYQNLDDTPIPYTQFMEEMAESLLEEGYELSALNGAEVVNSLLEILKEEGAEIPDSERELLGLSEEQYDELIGLFKEYGEDHPAVGFYISNALDADFDPVKYVKMIFTEDEEERRELFGEYYAAVTKDITDEDLDLVYIQLSDTIFIYRWFDPSIKMATNMPNPYDYTKISLSSSKTAAEYPLAGAMIDMMMAEEAIKANMDYATFMKDVVSTEVGIDVKNGAEAVELLVQYGLISCTSDLSCADAVSDYLGIPLTIDLTKAEYDKVLDVVREYGKDHPGAGYMAIQLVMTYPALPLDDMMAILYAEDSITQEALIDELIDSLYGEIDATEREAIKQEMLAVANQVQQESAEMDTMYAQLGIPLPYDYVYAETIAGSTSSVLNFAEGAMLNLNSKISGEVEYGLTLAGADDAIINLNSEIEKADLVLDGPILKLSDESTNLASVNSFEVKNGTLDLQNDAVRTLIASNFKVSGAMSLLVDADLANKQMDTLGEVEVTDGASISVDGIKILSDATDVETLVEFAGETYKDKVTTTVDNVLSAKYTYAVTYDATTGEFKFVQGAKKAPEEVAPNQAPVLSTTTTVATVETVVAQIFDRDVTISTDTNYGADTTDYVETADGVNIHNDKSLWVKTFGSDDDVEVENFNSTIDAEAYGVVGGVDSKVFTYDNGVKAAYGVYGAYVGGKQKYNDSKITQDSGYLGVSASFRKNNLFSNFTLNGGYITSEANTAWGKDKFDTKTISVANKTGVDIKTYNNWKITPALYVAYTGMDTEDYTNKAGVKMENEFSNVITIAPELKVSNRIGKDLDGYAKVSYKHYIYDAEVRADDVLLEEMSAKPYVEYGFGVEKNWADKSGYFELTRRSGGREGWNVNLGLNFDF